MPVSKRHLKRRKKVKPQQRRKDYEMEKSWDGKGGYTKTNGLSQMCYYDKYHRLQKIL